MSSEACYKDAGSQHSGGMGEQQSKSKDGLQGYPNKLYPRTVKAHKDIQLSRAHCPDTPYCSSLMSLINAPRVF